MIWCFCRVENVTSKQMPHVHLDTSCTRKWRSNLSRRRPWWRHFPSLYLRSPFKLCWHAQTAMVLGSEPDFEKSWLRMLRYISVWLSDPGSAKKSRCISSSAVVWWEMMGGLMDFVKLEAAVYKYPRRNDRHVPQCPHSTYPHSIFGLHNHYLIFSDTFCTGICQVFNFQAPAQIWWDGHSVTKKPSSVPTPLTFRKKYGHAKAEVSSTSLEATRGLFGSAGACLCTVRPFL